MIRMTDSNQSDRWKRVKEIFSGDDSFLDTPAVVEQQGEGASPLLTP